MRGIFKENSTVLFRGDSITDCGREGGLLTDAMGGYTLGIGYAAKVAAVYGILYPSSGVRFVNRGVSGDRSRELLERYEKDFKEIEPDYLSVLVGVNDTWRRFDSEDPTSAADFECYYETLLEKIKRDLPHTKLMMIEPFLLRTDENKLVFHDDLDPKIEIVRKLAARYADVYLPLGGIFQTYLVKGYTDAMLSEDGVHPTQIGHGIIAQEYLKAWACAIGY